MAEVLDEASHLESSTVAVSRTAATVKGGRRFSFGALVVVGDRRGKVGYGYGKSNEVPSAIEKAQKQAKRELSTIPMAGRTIPHQVEGRFGSAKVRLVPASPGTGVVAGGTVRTILEMAGITDCLTKCYGSTNKVNVIKAVFDGISKLQQREQIEELRGLTLGATETELRIERGLRFMPKTTGQRMAAPVNTVGQERRGGGRGRPGGGRRRADAGQGDAQTGAVEGASGTTES
ncbi:MAG: 30S ribosomal protein S5 [Leptolyngbya sp. PLA3]|nr:MAG: 30S ribosomal protein S5 [Cyanobacteria bacterium CYA]MCE7969101.1 30S ribosomal protein S5 [Leptolyngbya sp. PL-A3]